MSRQAGGEMHPSILGALSSPIDDGPVRYRERLWRSARHGDPVRLGADRQLVLEDGTYVGRLHGPDDSLPIGVHAVFDDRGDLVLDLAVVPGRLPTPTRSWGFSLFLRSLRSAASWGAGDFADLAAFADWCAGAGAAYLFIGPTNAGRAMPPQIVSPYSPSSCLFQDPAYLHCPAIEGWHRLGADLRASEARGRQLNGSPRVDVDAVLRLKLPVLRALFEHHRAGASSGERTDFSLFRAAMGRELRLFALHRAIEARHGSHWPSWPVELRDPTTASQSEFAMRQAETIAFHEWCQWKLDQQLRSAGARVGLVRDRPVGVPLASADGWAWQQCLAPEWELGAPPDYFNPDGHRWGLVPFHPEALRAVGFQPFRLALRNTLRHAAGVRVDHALGLLRQYWIPLGGSPAGGRFVAQPTRALLDVICIETHRAGGFVVAEELGTRPPGGTAALRDRGFLSYSVVMSDEYDGTPAGQVVAATTHDLPTVPGCWTGADGQSLSEAGVKEDPAFLHRARCRVAAVAGIDPASAAADAVTKLYGALARGRSTVLVVSLEDALGITQRPNLPGVPGDRWPSFSRALSLPLEDLVRDRRVRSTIDAVRASR